MALLLVLLVPAARTRGARGRRTAGAVPASAAAGRRAWRVPAVVGQWVWRKGAGGLGSAFGGVGGGAGHAGCAPGVRAGGPRVGRVGRRRSARVQGRGIGAPSMAVGTHVFAAVVAMRRRVCRCRVRTPRWDGEVVPRLPFCPRLILLPCIALLSSFFLAWSCPF